MFSLPADTDIPGIHTNRMMDTHTHTHSEKAQMEDGLTQKSIGIQTQVRMEKKQKAMVARAASEPWANGSSSGEVACH